MKAQWLSGEVVFAGNRRNPLRDNEVTSEQWDKLELIPGLGYVGVMVGSMFIGIEPDGYSHT